MKVQAVIVEHAYILAASLPQLTFDCIVDVLLNSPPHALSSDICKQVPHHQHRGMALSFIELWKTKAQELDSTAIALALQMAAYAENSRRQSGSTELVWTGPKITHHPCRHTEQAILEIIQAAKRHLLIVSFAVYKIPNISSSLIDAVKRGVKLTIIVETPDRIEGAGEYDTIRALGADITSCASIYYWPREHRDIGDNGKAGILHVKCVVADGELMLLSSANLTHQAFTVNMELGVLIRGGNIPAKVDQQFMSLINHNLLMML